jgi:hypothetical protein
VAGSLSGSGSRRAATSATSRTISNRKDDRVALGGEAAAVVAQRPLGRRSAFAQCDECRQLRSSSSQRSASAQGDP